MKRRKPFGSAFLDKNNKGPPTQGLNFFIKILKFYFKKKTEQSCFTKLSSGGLLE
jgi:hypothetical protein